MKESSNLRISTIGLRVCSLSKLMIGSTLETFAWLTFTTFVRKFKLSFIFHQDLRLLFSNKMKLQNSFGFKCLTPVDKIRISGFAC